jgi:ribA/ribD-fused uncharacterized protein
MIQEFQNEYRWLSNFWPVDIEYQGRLYPSVEHAYMSAKSMDEKWKLTCTNPGNVPGKIKIMSRSIKLRPDWEQIKLSVMEECLRKKYSQEPFRTKLLNTGTENLVEGNRWGDTFWGWDLNKRQGFNHLGRLIMKIRSELVKG